MKITEIKPRTFLLDFETREELLKTFIRFQEYYESPEFKGKVFSVEEYSKWYVDYYKKESFSYYEDWSGCNVPSYVFDFFRQGQMNPLSAREQSLLAILPSDGLPYYVIGVFQGGSDSVIEHEICHALFYSNEEYKNKVLEELSKYDTTDVQKYVLELGYHDSVLLDEVHAYICASKDSLEEESVNFSEELHLKLVNLVKVYS